MDEADTSQTVSRRNALRLVRPVVIGLSLVLAVLLIPPWIESWWAGLRGDTRRSIAIGFLEGTLIGYGVVVVLALGVGVTAMARVIQGRRRGLSRPLSARLVLLCISCLIGLLLIEFGAWRYNVWTRRLPDMPAVPPAADSASRDLTILVLGESSAEGQPYQGWLSIGDIVAWQLERALPGTRVEVIMGATGGVPLAYSFPVMGRQPKRPDLVLVYAGHNEFQALWGWTRSVNYYTDELATRESDGLVDRVKEWTPLCEMIHGAVEHQRIDLPPSIDENRKLGERPVCEPETRARLRDLFENEIEVLVRWCEQAGAMPILVIPAGNDVGYDPSRSIMAPETSRADREAFLREFELARDEAESGSERAISLLRSLIDRQPLYAEAHYVLAQRLQQEGNIDEARDEYALARDLDGMPMRCPSEYQDAYRAVASRHDVMLIDATAILQALSPSRLLDDNVFHDGQHTTFRGYLALSQKVMDGLWASGKLGLPKGPAPRLDPDECARHFGINDERWADVCRRSANFWVRLSQVRFDARARRLHALRYQQAAEAIDAGASPESLKIPGLGVHPEGIP